mgnify:CR=1 FL=1
MIEIPAKDVESLLSGGESLNIVDVREGYEVSTGKIPGAVNIPFDFIGERLDELDPSQEYIMVCRSGARSHQATQFLLNQGYNANNMSGGMLDWNGEVV